jgi:hypothetical protein
MMLGKETITPANEEDAIHIRRSVNSAFSHHSFPSLVEQEPMMQAHVSQLMAKFKKHSASGCPIYLCKWFTFSMFDINSNFGFAVDMGCVKISVLNYNIIVALKKTYKKLKKGESHVP